MPEDAPEDNTTDSTATRYPYTNDLIAGWLVVSFSLTAWFHMAGWTAITQLPGAVFTLYATFVGVALAWAFGPEAVKAWNEGK